MMGDFEVRELIDDLFEEEVLVIGGLVAVYGMNDDLVSRLVSNLQVIREKTMRRIDAEGDAYRPARPRPVLKSHPAVEKFLQTLRES